MHNLVKESTSVSEVNRLLYTVSYVVAERLGLIGKKKQHEKKKPKWQRRIESSILNWRKNLARIEELKKGTKLPSGQMKEATIGKRPG